MKVQTYTLIGDALNRAVAKCEGVLYYGPAWTKYSTDWAYGGPIIEREKIALEHLHGAGDAGADVWVATRCESPCVSEEHGTTPLIAAMRCYVASKLGDEIEMEELK